MENNDIYLSIKQGTGPSLFQRLIPQGELPWGIEGVAMNTPYASLRPSNPVITPDGGVMVFSNRNHEAVLLRATPEGEPYFEGGYVLYEIIDLITIPSPLLISSPADSTYMCFNQLQIDLFTKRFVGFKFNDEGNNVWETTPHIFQEYGIYNGIEAFYGTLASDGSAILCIQWDRELTGTRLHLHKILPNGHLCGDTTNAVEESGFKTPVGFGFTGSYPNPFNGSVTLLLETTVPGDYRWEVFNLEGRLVHQGDYTAIDQRQQTMVWKPGNMLGSGVYFVTLNSEKYVSNPLKIVYLR